MLIQPRVKYSRRSPFLIRPCLHVVWETAQQQDAQLEQRVGLVQRAQDVSTQPQLEHEGTNAKVTQPSGSIA